MKDNETAPAAEDVVEVPAYEHLLEIDANAWSVEAIRDLRARVSALEDVKAGKKGK